MHATQLCGKGASTIVYCDQGGDPQKRVCCTVEVSNHELRVYICHIPVEGPQSPERPISSFRMHY